jgi:hypothetical protein
MRMILATASFALLAACGGGASNNGSANGAAPANVAGAAPAASADAELAALRVRLVAGCGAEEGRRAPPGTDMARICGCAVDRLLAGKTAAQLRATGLGNEQEALNACAAEQGVTLAPRSAAPAPANAAAPAAEGNSAH